MAKRTWKLGEVCIGGIITVETSKQKIAITVKEWDYSKGSNKGSSQTNAKELFKKLFNADNKDASRDMSDFLHEMTTSYHSGEILEWIQEQVDTRRNPMFW